MGVEVLFIYVCEVFDGIGKGSCGDVVNGGDVMCDVVDVLVFVFMVVVKGVVEDGGDK